MGLLDRISYTMDTVKKQKEERELKRALELKALREKTIPTMDKLIQKYKAQVKYLDTDAYVFVIENGQERGIYIPYGTNEVQIDLKLDTFVNNFSSAAKHKMKNKMMGAMNSASQIGEEYDNVDSDRSSGQSRSTRTRGFWDNNVTLQDFDTSLINRKR